MLSKQQTFGVKFWSDFLPEWELKTLATGMGEVPLRFFRFGGPLVITLGTFLVHFFQCNFSSNETKDNNLGSICGLKFCLYGEIGL